MFWLLGSKEILYLRVCVNVCGKLRENKEREFYWGKYYIALGCFTVEIREVGRFIEYK